MPPRATEPLLYFVLQTSQPVADGREGDVRGVSSRRVGMGAINPDSVPLLAIERLFNTQPQGTTRL